MKINCVSCGYKDLDNDTIGINRKLLGRNINSYYCLECLADYMCTTKEDLIEKIEDFKDEGCELFN